MLVFKRTSPELKISRISKMHNQNEYPLISTIVIKTSTQRGNDNVTELMHVTGSPPISRPLTWGSNQEITRYQIALKLGVHVAAAIRLPLRGAERVPAERVPSKGADAAAIGELTKAERTIDSSKAK